MIYYFFVCFQVVRRADPHIGLLHRATEKLIEYKTYLQVCIKLVVKLRLKAGDTQYHCMPKILLAEVSILILNEYLDCKTK